jgi:hypothetical protein
MRHRPTSQGRSNRRFGEPNCSGVDIQGRSRINVIVGHQACAGTYVISSTSGLRWLSAGMMRGILAGLPSRFLGIGTSLVPMPNASLRDRDGENRATGRLSPSPAAKETTPSLSIVLGEREGAWGSERVLSHLTPTSPTPFSLSRQRIPPSADRHTRRLRAQRHRTVPHTGRAIFSRSPAPPPLCPECHRPQALHH